MIARIGSILALSMVFVFLLSTAQAMGINAPSVVSIDGKEGSFYVEITNDSSEAQDVKVEFFTPAKMEISAPMSVSPNTTASAKIKLYNSYGADTTVFSKLEVYLGKEMESKEISVRFSGTGQQESAGAFGALFSLGAFVQETAQFTLAEWAVFWAFVVIAAILLVAFIARLARRV